MRDLPAAAPAAGASRLVVRAGRALRVVLPLAVAVLAAFHALLLWRRVADLSLLEPAVALRWAGAALLLAALPLARRLGIPLLRGRRAVVFWVVVVLLHVQLLPAPLATADGEPLLTLLPAVASVAAALALLGALAACAGRPAIPRPGRRRSWRAVAPPRPAALSPRQYSRPPPALPQPL